MDFRRLFRRLFKRAARFLWCSPLVTARSMVDTASRYAVVASSLLFSETSLSSFFMDERSDERWPVLRARRVTFCLARFFAWGELAKGLPQDSGYINGRGNIVNFGLKVK